MFYLLDPRVWIAAVILVALTVTHTVAYRSGKANVRAEWNKDIAARTAQALQVEQENRAKEQQLVAARQQAEERYAKEKRKVAAAAAGAQSELDGLRNELATAGRPACADPAAAARADGGAGLERDLLGACATALVGMAQEADRLEAQLVGLQQYVKQVCLAK